MILSSSFHRNTCFCILTSVKTSFFVCIKLYYTRNRSVNSEVFPKIDILSSNIFCSLLSNNDPSSIYCLSSSDFYSQKIWIRISQVLRRTSCFFLSHINIACKIRGKRPRWPFLYSFEYCYTLKTTCFYTKSPYDCNTISSFSCC